MSESGLGMTYRHSMGLTFAHPANWAVQKTQFGLILTPPKPMVINGNDAESYLIMSEAAPGIKSPDDPRLAGYLDDLISTQMPSLVRTGQVESAKCGQSTGLIYHWQSPPDAAVDVIAQAYLCVSGESAVALLAIGPAESILARQEMLREIFSSFGRCEPETEPNPMGAWQHDDHYRTGEYASSWHRLVEFQPDGSFVESSRYHHSRNSSRDDLDVHDELAAEEATEQTRQAGSWESENGILSMVFDDGMQIEYDFRIEGHKPKRSMLLKTTDGSREVWQEKL